MLTTNVLDDDAKHERQAVRRSAQIAVELISNDPSQPRSNFDEVALRQLGNSMKSEGQQQDVLVRPYPTTGGYIIIAGERRWRAAKLVGLAELHCTIVENSLTEREIFRRQIIENALRVDLTPIEQGRAFQAAMELEGLNGKELADRLNIHPSTVSRTLRLLTLSQETQNQLNRGELTMKRALDESSPKSSKKTAKRSVTFRCSNRVRIVIESPRKSIEQEEIVAALQEALTRVSQSRQLV